MNRSGTPRTDSTRSHSPLATLMEGVRADVVVRQLAVPFSDLRERVSTACRPVDAGAVLRGPDGVRVIGEVKRADPARGPLADVPDPGALAAAYVAGGAAAVSVVTEQRRHRGAQGDFDAVRAAVDVPVMLRDFVVTEYQVWEARARRADLLPLMAAALPGRKLERFLHLAEDIGLTPVVEAHTEEQVTRALAADARIIAIDARDPHTLALDPDAFAKLSAPVPPHVIRIAQSGITTPADAAALREAGADTLLVGAALITSPAPATLLSALTSTP
ncbi:indole-3-glycerol-phosphate synthase [Streptomyces sp. NPDC101132]|uniref:indole-3-glycerol phosphate synthase TrpC n=1 Tax=Streptomyces sp. NPDC101132 TaxID=3366110 RepID=UPI003826F800